MQADEWQRARAAGWAKHTEPPLLHQEPSTEVLCPVLQGAWAWETQVKNSPERWASVAGSPRWHLREKQIEESSRKPGNSEAKSQILYYYYYYLIVFIGRALYLQSTDSIHSERIVSCQRLLLIPVEETEVQGLTQTRLQGATDTQGTSKPLPLLPPRRSQRTASGTGSCTVFCHREWQQWSERGYSR